VDLGGVIGNARNREARAMASFSKPDCAATGLLAAMALLGTLLLDVAPAVGGVGGGGIAMWPASATVGELFTVSALFTNSSTPPNNTESVTLTTIVVTPACADLGGALCFGSDVDPDIFKVLSAVGDSSTAPCAGVEFDLSTPDMTTGAVTLTAPMSTNITLGAVNGGVNLSCQVNITLRVFMVPTNPAAGPSVTTWAGALATLKGAMSGLNGIAFGWTPIQIEKAAPGVMSVSNPNGTNVVPGSVVTDTATVIKAPGAVAPTGSVRFILCQPNEVTAAGCPGGVGTKVGPDKTLVNKSARSGRATDTTTLGKYCWRVRYLGDSNYNPQNHTNATTECFTVQ